MKVGIHQEGISDILKAVTLEDFERNVMAIVEQICAEKSLKTNSGEIWAIMEYINEHCCDYEMSLEMLREQFGYGITQLSHIIKEHLGESFRTYVTTLRMKKAQELLKTGMTVADISVKVGYGSVSHFIKTFKTFYGHKPSFFRNGNRGI